MDIASSGEDNANLFAVPLILQGDRTTGDFSETLSQVSLDFKDGGYGINYASLSEIRQFIFPQQGTYGLNILQQGFYYTWGSLLQRHQDYVM